MAKYNSDTVISRYHARLKEAIARKETGELSLTVKLLDGGIRDVETNEKLKVKPCNNN